MGASKAKGWTNRDTAMVYAGLSNNAEAWQYWTAKAKQAGSTAIGAENLAALLFNRNPAAQALPVHWEEIAEALMERGSDE